MVEWCSYITIRRMRSVYQYRNGALLRGTCIFGSGSGVTCQTDEVFPRFLGGLHRVFWTFSYDFHRTAHSLLPGKILEMFLGTCLMSFSQGFPRVSTGFSWGIDEMFSGDLFTLMDSSRGFHRGVYSPARLCRDHENGLMG